MRRTGRQTKTNSLVASIDIGSAKTTCLIGALTVDAHGSPEIDVIGAGQYGVAVSEHRRPAAAAAEEAIRGAVDAAERMAGERIRDVSVVAPGRGLVSRRLGVELDLADGAATREDVTVCLDRGARVGVESGEMLLHALPSRFFVDGEDAGIDPTGLIGAGLSTEMVSIAMRANAAANYRMLLERCGLSLSQIIARPFAAGEAVLIEDEKDLGVLLVDIGARSTDYAIYQDGALSCCGGVAVGGEHVTRDLAQIFDCSIADAERIKTLHGSALAGAGDDHRLVDAPRLGEAAENSRVSRAEISAVIAARLEEIYALILEAVRRAAPARANGDQALRRAVLTGGGSLLTGGLELAERVFKVRSRLGRPTALSGAPDAATAPQCAACVGALVVSARADQNLEWNPTIDPLSFDAATRPSSGVVSGLTRWLKANF